MSYTIEDFDFHLPPELIADEPLADRSASRMLALDRLSRTFDDSSFVALPEFFRDGDVLVLNNTKVFPARLFGRSSTGANVEIFLIEEKPDKIWNALARPAKRLQPGKHISFNESLTAEVIERGDGGTVKIRFDLDGDLDAAIDRIGRTPLPPYIKRMPEAIDADRDRYQ